MPKKKVKSMFDSVFKNCFMFLKIKKLKINA